MIAFWLIAFGNFRALSGLNFRMPFPLPNRGHPERREGPAVTAQNEKAGSSLRSE
jgi:hypothetical protein